MRDLSFRGKSETNGEWINGYYYYEISRESHGSDRRREKHHIFTINYDKFVVPETVGQYTGLKDKNGRKIFEGDIVKVYLAYKTIVCIVKWEDCSYVLQDIKIQDYKYSMGKSFELEVIGNIYDNPELLEVADGR